MIRGLTKWCFAGALTGLLLGVADGLVLALSARVMFFDTRELLQTVAATAGVCAGAGVVAALVVGTIAETLNFASLPGRALDRRFAVEAVLTALYAAPLDLALWMLTAGPQASQLPMRPLMVGLVAFLLGAIGAVVTTRAARFGARRRSHRRIIVATAVAIAAVLYAIDLIVLVRLYPAFHYGLTALAFLLVTAALRLLWLFGRWRAFNRVTALVALLAVVGCAFSMYWIRSSQNPRFVVGERTAAAVDVVTAVRAIAPPAPRFEEADNDEPAPSTVAVPTGPAISRPGSPVFLISVDAMRHDRLILGDPGERRQVARNLDALAAKSVVFERAYTPIPHTSYAVTSILTGKYVHRLFDVPGAPAVHETWPEVMRRFRYRTGGFFTKAVVFIDRARFDPYLRKRFGFDEAELEYRVPAAERVRQTIDFLERTRAAGHGSRVFTWTHFFEPHEPYDPECKKFGSSDVDRYDCEIAVVDEAIGELLKYIDEHYPEAIVIATADHGEEFDDHGGRYHGTTLYDEQVRVPLMIRVPGVEHRVVKQPVNLVDLLGTTLSMLEIPIPARMRSIDLTGLLTGRDKGPFESLCEVHDEVMIVRQDHKLICDRKADLCRLYDLAADPGEQRSIAGSKPELVRELDSRIRAWERSHPRIELRPIIADDGARGWPAPIRRALAGDESAAEDLLEVIGAGAPEPVRRKGAELVAELWGERDASALVKIDAAGDPVVSAWIAVARHRATDPEALTGTDEILPALLRLSPPWRALVLARLESGDRSAIPDACDIAADQATPHPERWKAVDLLSRSGDRVVAETLTLLIDDYQLSLDVVAALAELRYRPAIPLLLKRLKRERFPERRAAVAVALAALGDRRAIPQLAGELAREEPAPDVLRPLLQLGAASARGKKIRAEVDGAEVTIWSPVPEDPLGPKSGTPSRLFLLTTADADGGQVLVTCDGDEASAPIFGGEQTSLIELDGCEGDITMTIEPADLHATIEAVAIVVPD
ncbi:MAG: sulfatase-like hydrolase/transferase [Deltaproteobacteria bacterium]|nr:sulfatase-like hydrolase/transferase [Deltaproteobacteria bacterium]